jgi:hypothetical protein
VTNDGAVTHVGSELGEDIDEHVDGVDQTGVGGSGPPVDTPPPTGGRRPRWRRRRVDKSVLLVSLVIGFGLFLVIRGLSVGISSEEQNPLPDVVEEVDPVPEAVQVPNQTRVFADLDTGYTGVFVIDGIEIETVAIRDLAEEQQAGPGVQLELPPVTIYEGGNNTLTFVPNDAAPITEFETGLHRVRLIYWDEEVGRQSAKSYSWTFNVF